MPNDEEIEEESDLEEKAEIPEVDSKRLLELLQPSIKSKSPVLEKVAIAPETPISLEEEVGFAPIPKKEDSKKKYGSIRDADYQSDSGKKERDQLIQGGEPQFNTPQRVDMNALGREQTKIGREVNLIQNPDLSTPSGMEYESFEQGKSPQFKGENQLFQDNLAKKYEFKN